MKHQREGGFLIGKIHRLAGRILAQKLREHNITHLNPAQGRIMFVLWRGDGISINELAKHTGLSKSTLTSMLDRLEEGGLLIREPSREDRRKILIKLTDKDRQYEEAYRDVSMEMTDLFYREFTPEEIEEFETNLRRILENLGQFEEQRKKNEKKL